MNVAYKEYIIEIFDDKSYNIDSTDNINIYDAEIYDRPLRDQYYWSKCGVRLLSNKRILKSIILCGSGSPIQIGENSFVVIQDKMYVAVGYSIFSINLPDLSLNWFIQADDSCCFEIFSFNDYLVTHGELSITGIGKDGEKRWQHYGSDIFVTPDGSNCFEIKDDVIIAEDWNGLVHKLNRLGQRVN